MKRIVQAFQYIFLCIALSSGGMSPLIGAANDDVVEKIKNALSELAIAYKKNDKNPSGFQEVKRTDVKGSPHKNKDGTYVPTPHVHTKGSNDVQPAVKGKDY